MHGGAGSPEMPNPVDLGVLLRAGESQTVEWKASFDRETIETLVAFANAEGGTVLIGVGNDGAVRGVTLGKETLNEWLGQVKAATSPTLIPDVQAVDVEGRTVVVWTVGEYPVKPVNTRGRYFKRRASSNHQLGLSEITDLYLQSLRLSIASASRGPPECRSAPGLLQPVGHPDQDIR